MDETPVSRLVALSEVEGVALCLFHTVAFIAGFFLLKESPRATSDDPKTIKQRVLYALSVSIVCPLLLAALLQRRMPGLDVLTLYGLRLEGLLPALVLPLLLTMVLFAGPLVLGYFDEDLPGQSNFSWRSDVLATLTSYVGVRNFIVAPATEEIVFRSCCVTIMFLAGFSNPIIVFCCPLFFGLAHFHKLRDAYKKSVLHGKRENSFKELLLQTLFQCLYTTIFGWFSTFVFLRTGHIIAPIICHAFCNSMGFPAFDRVSEHPRYAHIIWTAFVIGLAAFFFLLFPLTDPAMYMNNLLWG